MDVRLGGDLAGDDRHAGRDQRLAGDSSGRIARQDGVEHGIGDLIGDFVGMTFGDGLGREDVPLRCSHLQRVLEWVRREKAAKTPPSRVAR